MFPRFFNKRKLTENLFANVFVNTVFGVIENVYPDLCLLIKESPELLSSPSPSFEEQGVEKIILIALTLNIEILQKNIPPQKKELVLDLILQKSGMLLKQDAIVVWREIVALRDFLAKINSPSKKLSTAMAKGILFKYNLISCQDDFYAKNNVPNPILLKRLEYTLDGLLYDWNGEKSKFQLI